MLIHVGRSRWTLVLLAPSGLASRNIKPNRLLINTWRQRRSNGDVGRAGRWNEQRENSSIKSGPDAGCPRLCAEEQSFFAKTDGPSSCRRRKLMNVLIRYIADCLNAWWGLGILSVTTARYIASNPRDSSFLRLGHPILAIFDALPTRDCWQTGCPGKIFKSKWLFKPREFKRSFEFILHGNLERKRAPKIGCKLFDKDWGNKIPRTHHGSSSCLGQATLEKFVGTMKWQCLSMQMQIHCLITLMVLHVASSWYLRKLPHQE